MTEHQYDWSVLSGRLWTPYQGLCLTRLCVPQLAPGEEEELRCATE